MSSWTVPGYAFASDLGQNTTGRTVLASHAATGVQVAIKYLADDLCVDEEYRNRYRAQARLLADLDSPEVAALYEYVEADHGVATVREYVVGISLRALIAAHGALSPEASLSVLKGGLLGLHHGHTAGVTHGAYKPENVLVDLVGQTKLSDFGVAAVPTTAADDIAAAVATFVECLTGARGQPAPALDRVPKRLHRLLPSLTAGDSTALLADLDIVARRAYGDGWESRGRGRLAKRAVRHAGIGRSGHVGD